MLTTQCTAPEGWCLRRSPKWYDRFQDQATQAMQLEFNCSLYQAYSGSPSLGEPQGTNIGARVEPAPLPR